QGLRRSGPSARGTETRAALLYRVTMTTESRIYATGKRKTAVARVFMSPGTGKITVNRRPADEYFVRETSRMVMRQSLELIEVLDQYDIQATVCGGGHSAQAEAMRHGIARALIVADPERRPSLKRAGFL